MKNLRYKRLLSAIVASTLVATTVFTSFAEEAKTEEVQVEETAETSEEDGMEFEELDEEILSDEEDTPVEEAEEEEPEYADDEQVRVFIVFDDDSVVDAGYDTSDIVDNKKAIAYSDKLEAKQDKVMDKVEDVVEGDIDTRYNFTLLTDAVSADVTYGDIEAIEEVKGVEAVYVVPVYETEATTADPETITAGDMVGSYDTWTNGYDGAGMRVAIIDTGLDEDHPSFDGDAYMYSLEETAKEDGKEISDYDLLDEAEISEALSSLNASSMYEGLTASDLYRTSKVAFGFNYVDEDLDITHDNDSEGEHGTHVAGITTANKYVPQADGTYAAQESGVVGVAPNAQLMVMKVFGKAGGAYTDDYMAAIEDAIVLGADAINLSLGSSSAGESADSEAYVNEIFDKLVNSDTVVSISAGNSSYWSEESQYGANLTTDVEVDTVGSPGSYTNALTVASCVNSGYTGYAVAFDDATNVYYDDGSGNNAAFKSLDTNGNGTEYDYVLIDGKGEASDYEGLDVTGKIVLVSRGTITFAEKHMNAEAAGAAGLLVYNNQAGTISMSLSGSDATIPCASIKLSDAYAIIENATASEDGVTYTGKCNVSSKVTTCTDVDDGYTMSDFSSWGVPGSLELKPEITAPGGNIYSTIDDGQYGLMSGTSMAAPSITGLSALTIQYIEENDLATKTGLSERTLAQSLLMSTATPLVEEDGEEYSPRKQGAGLANTADATTTPAYILVGDKENNDGKVKVELGDDPDRTGSYSFSFDVYSLTDETSYYVVDSSVLTESAEEYEGLSYILNSSYSLAPSVKISADNSVLLYDVDGDNDVDKDDATALLKFVNGSLASDYVTTNENYFDFNENGVVDTADVRTLLLNVNGKSSKLDLASTLVAVSGKTTVNVSINLSDSDRQYLDSTFENGMYVEGFVYLKGGVDLSVPFLAFYGNWTDSSMFEPYDYLDAANGGEEGITYTGVEKTNYLTYQFAESSKSYLYKSNMYETDSSYVSDRNAISSKSGDSLGAFYYSLIRNAATVEVSVTDADTDEEYYSLTKNDVTGAFYYSSDSAWYNSLASIALNWKACDADGEPLFDGTKVNVTLTALPAYYNDETKVPGEGASITIPFTIDNKAPSAVLKSYDADAKTMVVEAQDTNYVSAIKVYANDKKTLISSYAVNQEEAGEPVDITIEYPETVFYVTVLDYAGNATSYRVNKSGADDTTITTGVTLSNSTLDLMKGSTAQLTATVSPVNLTEEASAVTWSTSDANVVTVDEDGVLTGVSEGTATITATTVAKNADKQHETATCEVTVFSLDVDLNATLWDENGGVYFANFNAGSLPSYDKASEQQDAKFWAATVVGDKLIASTYNKSDDSSDFYEVDPVTFESTKLYTSYWNTDMTYGEVNDQLYGTYATYVIISTTEQGDVGELDFSKKTGGNSLVGITYAGKGNSAYGTVEWFYLIDTTGELYQWGYISGVGSFFFDLGSTGVSTNGKEYYQSLYYDAEDDMIFYSCYDNGSVDKLYAIKDTYDSEADADIITTYTLGSFPDNVWPVSGLYQFTDGGAVADTEGLDLTTGFESKTDFDTITRKVNVDSTKASN